MIGLSVGIGFTKFIGGGGTPPVHTPQTYALVGNSLFNFGLDHSVASILAELAHPTDTMVQQITFNQNLKTNWDSPAGRTTGIDVKAYLASDGADFLGLVDLPGINDSLVDPAVSVVDWWQQADNAGLRGTFYQMWYPVPDFDTTPNWVLWKAFIVFLRAHHDRVLYDVRATLGGPEVLLAPVADVLVAIYDAIEAEELDATFTDFWHDALHLNELGYYVAALTHWAVMHQQSPVGLPWSFSPAIPNLDAPLAAALQAIVWDVVNADAYAKPGTWPSTVIPAAFASGQWSVDPGDEEIEITIGSLPNSGGASITDIEYELDASGSWISTGGTTGFTITGLTNNTEYDVRIRAKNSVGSGRASDVKAETPVSSAFHSDTIVSGGVTLTLNMATDYGYDQIGRACIKWLPGMEVVSRSPAATSIDGVANSGTMLNPVRNGDQGWDERTGLYDAGLNVTFPLAVSAGDILVATIAGATPTGGADPTRKGYFHATNGVNPFYFVSTIWGANAIAPAPVGWAGRGTPLPYYVDCAAIAASLPSYDITGFPNIPDKSDLLPRVQRNEVGVMMSGNTAPGGYQHLTTQGATDGSRSNYGSYQADTTGRADLLLISNGLTTGEKATLLAWRIAHGLLYDVVAGAADPYPGDGGHWQFFTTAASMALYYTGRSALIPTMGTVLGGNLLIQPFTWTSGMVADLYTPHSDLSKLWLSRQRTISAIAGDVITFSTDTDGDPSKFVPIGLRMKRVSDGVSALMTAQQDADIDPGINDFDVTVPGHTFSVSNVVVFDPPFPVVEGDADWRITGILKNTNPSTVSQYRQENKWVDDILPLRAQGIWDASFETAELYVARTERTNDPSLTWDYPTASYDTFSSTFWETHGPAILGDKPLFLSRPTITGDFFVGETLTAVSGSLAGDATITSTWQWYLDGVVITGETGTTYDVVIGDLGGTISVVQTATNSLGSRDLESVPTDAISTGFTLNAVEFDGTNDWLYSSSLTPSTASKQGTLVMSFKVPGATIPSVGSALTLRSGTSDRVTIKVSRNTGGSPPTDRGYLPIALRNASGTAILVHNTANGSIFPGRWYTIAMSWDTATSTWLRYIKEDAGAWATMTVQGTPTITADGIVGALDSMTLGASTAAGTTKLQNWYAAEVIFAPGVFLDLTNSVVLDSLLPTVGKGSDGSGPFGSAPYLYLSGDTATWHVNKGSGGGLTEGGALTTAPDVPPSSAAVPGTLTSGNWTATAGVDKIDVVVTTPPSDGGSTITDYEWELNASGTWTSGGSTSFSITGLTRGTAYAVRVRAKNAIGVADPSDSKSRTPPWQCVLTSAFFDFGGGDGFRGAGFSPWALNFGSKDREPIPSLTLIGAYYYTVNGETYIAFQGDQQSILAGMSVYIDSTEYAGTWVYNASSDYGVPATILVSAAGDIPVGTRMMEIRAAS